MELNSFGLLKNNLAGALTTNIKNELVNLLFCDASASTQENLRKEDEFYFVEKLIQFGRLQDNNVKDLLQLLQKVNTSNSYSIIIRFLQNYISKSDPEDVNKATLKVFKNFLFFWLLEGRCYGESLKDLVQENEKGNLDTFSKK